MASLLHSSRSSPCLSCLRRMGSSFAHARTGPNHIQIRGKKKIVTPPTIKVRLLKDVSRYGRQGAIIPVAAGRMRNEFYPKNLAEYVTKKQLKKLGIEHVQLERDSTFGISRPEAAPGSKDEEEIEGAIEVHADLLKPERAMEVLNELLPPNINFFRTPIAVNVVKKISPSIPASSAISVAAQETSSNWIPENAGIYGSVSTADIASNLKAVLAEDEEGSRVLLSPDDIVFVKKTEEKDRVKHLGIYEIDIMVKGASDFVRRTIKVNIQN